MSSAKEHYDRLLANYYSWFAGDFKVLQEEFSTFLQQNKIFSDAHETAIDLGAGQGIQSVALAKAGFRVKAIDFNQQLLDELKENSAGLDIEIIYDDIRNFKKHGDSPVSLIICWGDTLTHLDSFDEVIKLLEDCCSSLIKGGKLFLSFRNFSLEVSGENRFIPVKSDASRILTCFLEYMGDKVRVTDLIYENENGKWVQKISSYHKLRLPLEFVEQVLKSNSMYIIYSEPVKGLLTMIAEKQ
jgi:2-polyprenyl-3-methyl-5-hydroxy-6-metoxy-1,4-benzoquinol methylase